MRIRRRKSRPVPAEVQAVADELQKRLAARDVERSAERRQFGATRDQQEAIDKLLSGYPAVTRATHGSVVMNVNGTVSYRPNADFNGSDSYTYTVSGAG